jgi:hypothetical protein
MTTISERRVALEKARQEFVKEAMRGYDVGYHEARKQLRDDCGATGDGHAFRFSNFGPLGHAWFHCIKCGASKVEGPDE